MSKTKNPGGSALDRAIMAEIEDRAERQKLLDAQASAMADFISPADPAAPVSPAPTPAPTSNRNLLATFQYTAGGLSPSSNYVDLPSTMAEFVQEHTAFRPESVDATSTNFTNAEEYFEVLARLNAAVQALPVRVPAPSGWLSEFNGKGSHIDVGDFLNEVGSSSRRPEMLMDLVRWACTVQRQYEGAAARATLQRVQELGKQADTVLRNSSGVALLNKFNTLVSLAQTSTFSGRPELLTQCLLDDWKWLEAGVTYKTALATLEGGLYDSSTMTASAFIQAGSLDDFLKLHEQQLIDEYRCNTALRDPEYNSVAIGYAQKHSFCRAERVAFSEASPVIVELGYQEQFPEGAHFDSNEWLESWRDNVALRCTRTCGGIVLDALTLPHDALARDAVEQAVQVLLMLNVEGK